MAWKLGESLEAELVVAALRNALVLRQPDEGLYFYSDRGSQYGSQAVRKPLSIFGANLESEKNQDIHLSILCDQLLPGNKEADDCTWR